MKNDNTIIFDIENMENDHIKDVLYDVCDSLEDKGYNAIQQLVGYLMSGDLGYISNHREARKKLAKIDKEKILEVVLNEYLKDR